MGKEVPIEDRAVYCVQAYLTKKEYGELEKFRAKKKLRSLSAATAFAIRELLNNRTRTKGD